MASDDLRARIAEALNTTPAGFVQAEPDGVDYHRRHESHRHDRHNYYATCALCRGEADTLADAVLAVVLPELDRLRAACRSAAVLLRATADHRPDPRTLRAVARDLDEVAGPEPTQSTTKE